MIVEYSTLVLGICAVIFLIVFSLTVYSLVRFRARPDDDGREPPQVYGGVRIELAWTIVPIIIVAVLGLATARTILAMQKTEPPDNSLLVTVVGHQWWWEFEYPQYGFTTANELHIPVSDGNGKRPTFLALRSQDVIHSFWVPQLAGKTDLIPNRENYLWVEPTEEGAFVGQCAEYCGTQHANMLLRVVVHAEDEFEAWARAQQAPAVQDASVPRGARGLRADGVRELPHSAWHERRWSLRPRSDTPHEPGDVGRRRRGEQP